MKKVSFFKQIIALLLILKSASALWAAPPNMVLDISPSSANSFPQHWAIFNNKLYFNADNGTNGRELWVYDGT